MDQQSQHHPSVTWEWTEAPVDRRIIAEVEEAWGIRFPDDYVHCAMENHGGRPTPACFKAPVWGESVFCDLLSFNDNSPDSIVERYEGMKDALPPGVYPFADDPFGNHLCFDYRGRPEGEPVVVFWDHEGMEPGRPEAALHYVCGSFTELLDSLYECPE